MCISTRDRWHSTCTQVVFNAVVTQPPFPYDILCRIVKQLDQRDNNTPLDASTGDFGDEFGGKFRFAGKLGEVEPSPLFWWPSSSIKFRDPGA